MNAAPTRSGLQCPADVLSRHEAAAAELTEEINLAATAAEKAGPAGELVAEADAVLQCGEFREDSGACGICRNLWQLRRKAAALVVAAGSRQSR